MRPDLPPAPARIAVLPLTDSGYPVPWFATWIDGKPDLRVVDLRKMLHAVRHDLCWICGQSLGSRRRAYVIGPMCAITRTSGEPPAHHDCADWSARACPFLSRPLAKRHDKGIPEEAAFHPTGLSRNPGVSMVWVTRGTTIKQLDADGVLFDIGDPERITCYAEGRQATVDEIAESVRTGYPSLEKMAQEDGPGAVAELTSMTERANGLLGLPS
jgi:hypothetical protein